jgi:hypothetical protein
MFNFKLMRLLLNSVGAKILTRCDIKGGLSDGFFTIISIIIQNFIVY